MELLKDVPLEESEFKILEKLLGPAESKPPLESLSHSAAAILINLAIENVS